MPRIRLVLLAAAAMLVLGAAPAWGGTFQSTHFTVNYTTDPNFAEHIDGGQAADVAGWAERAYDVYVNQWHYPALSQPVEIDVVDTTALKLGKGRTGFTLPIDPGVTSRADIVLDYKNGLNEETVAHQVFDAVTLGVWNPSNRGLVEAAAEWGAQVVNSYRAVANTGAFDVPLDCWDDDLGPLGHVCGHAGESSEPHSRPLDDLVLNGGHWPFFEYLAERYGNGAVLAWLQTGAAAPTTSPSQALDAYLATKGTSLASFYNDWAVANMSNGYSVKALTGFEPETAKPPLYTGTLASLNNTPGGASSTLVTTGPVTPVSVVVNVPHLSVAYLAITKGDGVSTDACYAANLSLTVTMPSSTSARPYFQWGEHDALGALVSSAVPLTVSGTTATATNIPWDTCNWTGIVGYLALPNPNYAADAIDFNVSYSITVHPETPAGATAPPPLLWPKLPPNIVAAPTTDVTPTVDLLGPQTLHVPAATAQLRVVCTSSGPGRAQVTLGSVDLGSLPLRSGTNDLRFSLSASALQALSSAGASGVTMTLTPQSTLGVPGAASTRTVVLDSSPQAKAKTKTKTKTKAKAKTKRRSRR